MSEFDWKALGDKVSEETEVKTQEEETQKGKQTLLSYVLELGAKAGIILAVLAFVNETEYRHNEQTARMFEALGKSRPQSDLVAMAFEYLNREVHYPLCPFKSFCVIRSRRSFENFDFYHDKRGEGIRLEKSIMSVSAMQGAQIKSSDLQKINISEISLERASFVDVKMNGAKLYDVDLSCASFRNADLSDSEIYFKNISGAQFLGTNISNLTFPDVDLSSDTGKRDKDLEQRGLRPHTFAGAWAWAGEEPKVPSAYQTYEVCEKPEEIIKNEDGRPIKPFNCQAKRQITSIPPSICQQVDANAGIGQALVNWVDSWVYYFKG